MAKKRYVHLTLGERQRIKTLRLEMRSLGFIANALSRAKSTILRELRRNQREEKYWYVPELADRKARSRRKKPRRPEKMRINPYLADFVKASLLLQWSPEQISGRLRVLHKNLSHMQISTQCIYNWISREKSRGHSWHKHLRCLNVGYSRMPARSIYRQPRIANRVMIDKRPKSIEQRRFYGDWEGDTVHGKRTKGAQSIATLVDRKARYTLIVPIESCHAAVFNAAICECFSQNPSLPKRTLTTDNGTEFSGHEALSDALGIKVYFAHPHSSWERGTNENTNRLIRQYYPKGTNFQKVSKEELAKVQTLLNNRPRKILGYRTPAEVIFRRAPTVALIS